jgi:crossover junction endodeoxyribonuclease RusA
MSDPSAPPPAWMSSDEIAPPTIVLTLPIPPSANRLWRNVPGMKRPVLDTEYARWKLAAGWEAKMQLVGVPGILGAFRAVIEVPAKSRRDLDNWAKAIFDLAQSCGAVRNDKGNRGMSVVPANRDDVMLALWDLGGPELPIAKTRRSYAKPRAKKLSSAHIRRVSGILRGVGR